MGGITQMVYGDLADLMRIPEEILDCVAFLVTKEKGEDDSEKICRGTAFFVSIPSSSLKGVEYPYLVPAKHNIAKAIEKGWELYLRVNRREGNSEDVLLNKSLLTPDDPSVDIAVMPLSLDGKRYRYKTVPCKPDLADELKKYGVGIGDDVFISGLFTRRAGSEKNIPILRFGNIAAMPDELIPDHKTGLNFNAYLVEVRSIGGLSGSPVFVYLSPDRIDPNTRTKLGQMVVYLLGVVRGHWDHGEAFPFQSAFADELGSVNWGIGVVTPSTELIPLLYSEAFVKQRAWRDQKIIERDSPTMDLADDSTQRAGGAGKRSR